MDVAKGKHRKSHFLIFGEEKIHAYDSEFKVYREKEIIIISYVIVSTKVADEQSDVSAICQDVLPLYQRK